MGLSVTRNSWKRHGHRLAAAVVLSAAGGFWLGPAVGCGYHSPQSLALGALNWAYPNALYVRTAVWQAQDAGLLPPRLNLAARDMFAYHRTVANLERMRAVLQSQAQPTSELILAVLLLKPMLWSHYRVDAGEVSLVVHTDGTVGADVVVVTDEPVVEALAEGRLSMRDAEAYGLARYYGDADKTGQLRRLMQGFRGQVEDGRDRFAADQVK